MLVEAAPHKAHVNAVRFDAKGERLYSGDGEGSVAIWSCYESGNDESPIIMQCLKVVSLFRGAPINNIQVWSSSILPSHLLLLVHLLRIDLFTCLTGSFFVFVFLSFRYIHPDEGSSFTRATARSTPWMHASSHPSHPSPDW